MIPKADLPERLVPSNGPKWEITVAHRLDEIMQVISLRAIAYMHEQSCPYDEEIDGNDFAGATHLIARLAGEPVGCVRLRWFAQFFKVERVAVLPRYRKSGLGAALLDASFELGAKKGYHHALGHVEPSIVGLWNRACGVTARPGRPHLAFSDHEYVEVEKFLPGRDDAIHANSDPMVLLRPEGEWDHPGVLDRSNERLPPLRTARQA
ncbi:acetyltransferase [Candidatus Phycosocius bacilliformis]|uniref:Acetyltransferase n=1 Tax=Candidatus Phycosocius bacilliformis TaxID=1445552 RepID=A0A2P2E7A1_9PROT|nr:GNAT family N-acetyltransferase [Candidatus Phycosocius bacilliformis]GBF56943.1 acetyltransferase [Candidatus Phycosocius bacilliformis]